jgi:isoquinoline 1-oxidoreductase alpha subunit
MGIPLTLTVNGASVTREVEPSTLLGRFLRETLRLTGTHIGCDTTQCGACTVHVNGVATRSCATRVSAVPANAEITTIEGLSVDGTHALQRAWDELDVPQCGYCQAGQIMAAAALLAKNNKPTDAEIDTAMSRNICRCATYHRIRQGIHRAGEIMREGATPISGPSAKGSGATKPGGDR